VTRRHPLALTLALTLFAAACADLVTAPVDVRFGAVAAGGAHTCALDVDGGAWCWGSNSGGQLGVSRRHGSAATPVGVHGGHAFRAIAAGERHTCALDRDDRAWCWGSNDSGQLGDGGFDDRDAPRRVLIGQPLSRIALGGSHTCATDAAGSIWCWGRNDRGQAGPGPTVVRRPLRLEQAPRAGGIAAGGAHSCAIGSAGAFCWGGNDRHQLGGATGADSPLPVRVGSPGVLHVIALGRVHGCALTADQRIVCWGSSEQGQNGRPDTLDAGTAVPVASLGGGFAAVSAGAAGDLSCAAAMTAEVWCWGGRPDPRLGSVVTRPTRVVGLPSGTLSGLAVGDGHACVLVSERIACWGEGESGQLGDGRRVFSDGPVAAGSEPG
jgi:alpha-tubulin suppressor-like RCC1 family protein